MKQKFFLTSLTLTIGILIGVFFTVTFSGAEIPEPGTDGDPIITESYLELRLSELNKTLLYKIEEIKKSISSTSTNVNSYEVVNVKKGDIIYFGGNAEVILRAGEATAIAGKNGGIADLTTGIDLASGDKVVLNHLLLIARDDGRGMNLISDAWIMVKGNYTLKSSKTE
ncbi:hypothetical protein [Helicovermis profundi]|uniref:Uncharacterized protein n=1 Tax=Helicovermis profundi TaxID=3065157 RepID=A0AAU9E6J3_9FIRM|nr:hypothetical protein HLPR_05980 [Clostridia bacterium S502]